MAQPRWKRLGIGMIKLTIAAIILWGVGRHVSSTWNTLRQQEKPLRFEPAWLVLSGILYLTGLSFSGIFFHQVMRASPSPVRRYPAIRAYLVSHLAKYVPGKAMVVVVRAGMVTPYGAKGVTAAIATFYETLVMMSAGGLIAAASFGLSEDRSDTLYYFNDETNPVALGGPYSQSLIFAAGSLVIGLGFLVVVLPPVFRRLTRLVATPFGGAGDETLPRFSGRLLGWGLMWSALCWILLGLSQLAVVRAVSSLSLAEAARLAPLVIGSVAIATVAGFVVAVLPGGIGVREWVLMAALGPAVGDGVAVASALLLRLVWIAAELIAGFFLTAIRPRPLRETDLPGSTDLPAHASAPTEMGQNLP